MANTKQDINDFNRRIKKINNPRNKSYYDPDLKMHIPKRVPRDKIKKPKVADDENVIGPFIVSVVIGAFCLAVAQLFRVRYFELIETTPITIAIDLIAGLWVLLVLTALIKRNSWGARFSQIVGVCAMLAAGHNLFWRWPEQMATIYTPEYAAYIEQTTQPPSVVIGSTVYNF
ncbi:hypothetical protein [Cognatiyoonia sp. IB215182]|uniref:hypothetical protein n=1 Tax=Cognatiyoonia sp. IB215182 TaxID=3097353 RepID=UPI002A125B9D|nr:hypothetical protein [Cognatiyoonia sp. IB215182]MDX8352082.1 hypothetical protein [Cognatiyoonia sp. IB215182]